MDAIKVAKKKTDRVELKADPDWVVRVTAEAERFGLTLSAYIRLAVSEKMERDGRRRSSEPADER